MKKRNTYYKEVFGRPAMIKKGLLGMFLGLSYVFRVPIEVITRENMGERYFNIVLTILIALGLLVVPIISNLNYMGDVEYKDLFLHYGTWYIYTGYFCYSAYLRWDEIRRYPSVWDAKKFSMSSGDPLRKLYRFKVSKENQNQRFMSTIIEPGVFFVPGVILTILQQPLGWLFITCAIIYSLGYTAAYYIADQFVMDKIDEMICNEDMYNIFVNDIPSQRGFEFHAKRPKDRQTREKLYEDYMEAEIVDDDEPQVVR